jgi:hypothetical protein
VAAQAGFAEDAHGSGLGWRSVWEQERMAG